MLAQSVNLVRKASTGRAEKSEVTHGTRRQDDFFRGREGVLDASSIDKDAGGALAVVKKNFLHLRRLIELDISRLTQSLTQEGRLG